MTDDISVEEIKKTFGPAFEIQPLLAQLELHEVRLLESSSFLKLDIDEFNIASLKQNIYIEFRRHQEKSKIAFVFHLKLTGNSNVDDVIFSITAKYGAIYTSKTEVHFADEKVTKFSQIVGLNVIWPYWREFVQTITSRMSIPPLSLPLIRPGDLQFEKTTPENKSEDATKP